MHLPGYQLKRQVRLQGSFLQNISTPIYHEKVKKMDNNWDITFHLPAIIYFFLAFYATFSVNYHYAYSTREGIFVSHLPPECVDKSIKTHLMHKIYMKTLQQSLIP